MRRDSPSQLPAKAKGKSMTAGIPWVIFDADNTLWDVEFLYDEARTALCRFLEGHGVSPVDAEKYQQDRDKDLHATYGYSACRFARSFEDTAARFLVSPPPPIIRHVRQLGLQVFEQRARTVDDLECTLQKLRSSGYTLGIVTAGERWVQERRLSDFHLRSLFSAVQVVESKTSAVFKAFCNLHGVDIQTSWMVGDSPNSDIWPAQEAGLNAVLVKARNWTHIEGTTPAGSMAFTTIERLAELLAVLGIA
jgi:putative hydrolase of the HAD superfamily